MGGAVIRKGDCIKSFRAKHGLDPSEEDVIAPLHLMNVHEVDVDAALNQSSRSAHDHGVDARHYRDRGSDVFIFQSKLIETKVLALKGIADLSRARERITSIV